MKKALVSLYTSCAVFVGMSIIFLIFVYHDKAIYNAKMQGMEECQKLSKGEADGR